LPVSIRLNPKALKWAQMIAREKGVGYQTVINETLLKKAAGR
jgi:predicted DNA binding CopG/RHH family protein